MVDYSYDDHYSNKGGMRDLKPRDMMGAPTGENEIDFDAIVAASEARIAATLEAKLEVTLTKEELAKLDEIRWLHDTAFARAMRRDGYRKSGEGNVTIDVGGYDERMAREDDPERIRSVGVSIYSYVLGPNRSHYFATIDRALETVRVWYAQEMSRPETED